MRQFYQYLRRRDSCPLSDNSGHDSGAVGEVEFQSTDRRDAGRAQHRFELSLCIGLALRGVEKHIEGEEGRKERPVHAVVKDKFLHQQHAARLQCRHRPLQDDGAPFRPLAMQNMGEPGNVETAWDVVADEVSLREGDAVARPKAAMVFSAKGRVVGRS